jgi:diguanylate cyclase
MRFFTCLTDDHNLWLVALAAGLCLIGSIITFRLYRRLRAAEKGTRLAWAFMGAVATGATIWCTHFVAMIAYEPGVTISYGPVLTGLSLGVAIAGSALALWVASRRMPASAEIGGVLFGLTVVAMHYTGMAAFATDAVIHWSAAYVAASVAGAVVLGALAFNRARQSGKVVPVVLMVLGIVALHFTGMAAMTIVPVGALVDMGAVGSTNLVLAFAVSAVGLMMLGTGVASHALDVQSRLQAKARLDHLIEGSVDGMVVEQDGVILAANAAFADLAGVQHHGLGGRAAVALDRRRRRSDSQRPEPVQTGRRRRGGHPRRDRRAPRLRYGSRHDLRRARSAHASGAGASHRPSGAQRRPDRPAQPFVLPGMADAPDRRSDRSEQGCPAWPWIWTGSRR